MTRKIKYMIHDAAGIPGNDVEAVTENQDIINAISHYCRPEDANFVEELGITILDITFDHDEISTVKDATEGRR